MVGTGLIGRDREVAETQAALAQPEARGVLFAGPPGLGKSHLATALLEMAAEAGAPTLRVYGGVAVGDIPLGALAAELPDGLADGNMAPAVALKRLLGEQSRATVVLIDDGDLLDDPSTGAIVQAAEAGMAKLLVTQRPGTLLPDGLARMVRSGALHRLQVEPLDVSATIALAERYAGGPMDPESAKVVANLTDGNPLFVRELMLAARDSNALVGSPTGLRVEPIPADASRLRDLMAHRVAELSEPALSALIRVAAAEPLGPGELPASVEPSTLNDLDRGGHLTMALDGRRVRMRLPHPLLGEILRAGQSPLALRMVRGEIASQLASLGARRREDRLRLATWALDGGTAVTSEVLIEAARTAHVAGDIELAERLARAAFDRDPSFTTGWVLESALYELGDADALDAHFLGWAPLAEDDRQRSIVTSARATSMFWRNGTTSGIHDAMGLIGELARPEARDELTAILASLMVMSGDIARPLAMVEPMLDGPPDRGLIYAALTASHGLRASGRPLSAVAVAERAIAAYRSLGPAPMSVSDLVLGSARSGAMGDAGQLEAGAVIAAESVALGRDAGSHAAVGLGYLVLGWIDVYRGRLDRAVAQLGESDRSLAMAAHPGMRRWALAALGLARALGGDAAGAAETLERLDALGPHPALIFEGTVHRARAWLAFASGSAETAFGHLRRGAAECESAGNVLTALACWHDLARVGQAEAAAIGIDKLLASIPPDKAIEGTLLPAQIAHVRALASGDAAELVACVDRLVELGTTQWAAEAAEAAAVAATRTGDTRAVPGLLSRVSDLRGTMGAAPVAMRAIVDMPLTRREREVAVLAAQGLSSREIGDQLFVAARTVESHLARIYTKLGVHGRAELAQSINASGRAQIPAE